MIIGLIIAILVITIITLSVILYILHKRYQRTNIINTGLINRIDDIIEKPRRKYQ